MTAATLPLTIELGTTFELSITWLAAATPVNLQSYQARFNLKPNKNNPPWFVSSTQNGLAASTPVTGSLYFQIPSITTAGIPFTQGYYEVEVFSVEATPYVRRLMKGTAVIDRT